MSRDGRGNPSRLVLKNQPRLKLLDLLRRRRMTLAALLVELGITTYEALCIRCRRMGVVAPSLEEFQVVVPPTVHVNSPTEGVVVLEPPPVIAEPTGRELDEFPPEIITAAMGVINGEPVKLRRVRVKKDPQPAG